MKKLIVALMLIGTFSTSQAQDTLKYFKKLVYKVKVYGDKKLRANDYLIRISDTTMVLSKTPQPFNLLSSKPIVEQQIHYKEIEYVIMKRKGAAGRGLLYGSVVGVTLGVVLGLADGGDGMFTASELAIGGALLFGGAFGIIGAIIGAVSSTRFNIKGKQSALKELNTTLLEKVYGK